MSQRLEQRVTDWARWYHEHRGQIENSQDLKKTHQFYGTAIDGLIELLAIAAKDIQRLEHRAGQKDFKGLYLPRGVKLNEPVRL